MILIFSNQSSLIIQTTMPVQTRQSTRRIQYINENFKQLSQMCTSSPKYLTKQQFFRLLQGVNIQLKQEFLQLFERQYSDFSSKYKDHLKYKVPIQTQANPLFSKSRIEYFIIAYLQQSKKSSNSKDASKEEPRYLINEYQEKQEVELEEKSVQILKYQREDQYNVVQKRPSNEKGQDKEQQNLNVDQKVKSKEKIEPLVVPFIKEKKRSYQILLAFQTTPLFHDQLEEVKSTIKKHITNRSNGWLLDYYQQFFEQFLIYYLIKSEGSVQESSQQDEDNFYLQWNQEDILSKYIEKRRTYSLEDINESPLKKKWNTTWPSILQQAKDWIKNKEKQQKQKLRQILKRYLLEGISRVFLVSCNYDQDYAVNGNRSIMIFTNRQMTLSFLQFKNGPLKAYLYVCLMHQLTHYLIRSFPSFNIQIRDRSFKTTGRVGYRTLQIALQSISKMGEYFSLKEQTKKYSYQSRTEGLQQFKRLLKDVKACFQQHSQEMLTIKPLYQPIKQLYRARILIVQSFKNKKPAVCNLNDEDLTDLQNYITGLSLSAKISTKEPSKSKQSHYKSVFSLLLTLKDIFFMKISSVKIYDRCKQKLLSFGGQRYYQGQNRVIEKILKLSDIKEFISQNSELLASYNKMILGEKLFSQVLLQKATKLINQSDKLIKSQLQITNSFQSWKKIMFLFFNEFSQNKFEELKAKEKIYFINFLKISQGQSPVTPSIEKQLKTLFKLQFKFQVITQFFRFLQLFEIIGVMPPWFNKTPIEEHESGKIMERKVFPSLDQYIYMKDFTLVKELGSQKRHEVGLQPQSSAQQRLKTFIGRSASKKYPCIRRGLCGMRHLNTKYPNKTNKRTVSIHYSERARKIRKLS